MGVLRETKNYENGPHLKSHCGQNLNKIGRPGAFSVFVIFLNLKVSRVLKSPCLSSKAAGYDDFYKIETSLLLDIYCNIFLYLCTIADDCRASSNGTVSAT